MNAIVYFLIWAVVFLVMMRFGCGAHVLGHRHGRKGEVGADRKAHNADEGALWIPPSRDVDPVCRKTVSTDKAKSSVYGGSVYYFCSRECREIFETAPDQYVGPSVKQLEHDSV